MIKPAPRPASIKWHPPWVPLSVWRFLLLCSLRFVAANASLVPLLSEVFLRNTGNIDIRFAAGMALLFSLFMVVIAFVGPYPRTTRELAYRWLGLRPMRESDCSRCRVFCVWHARCAISEAILSVAFSPLVQPD